jgi:Phosphodiester glycosidase
MASSRLIAATGLALLVSLGCSAGAKAAPEPATMVDNQMSKELASGVSYYRADRPGSGGENYWFLSLGVARNPAESDQLYSCFPKIGLDGSAGHFTFPGVEELAYSEFVAGSFPTRAAAQEFADKLPKDLPCKIEIRASGMYSHDQSAPMVVHVTKIEIAKFSGKLITARGNDGAIGRAKPSDVVKRYAGALAATNGGYFVMESNDGLVGEAAGISVLSGQLLSEPTKGRPWALISNGARITVKIKDAEPPEPITLTAKSGASISIDGINRQPGKLRNCGALNDDIFHTAIHDESCAPQNEIIAVTHKSGITLALTPDIVAYRYRPNKRLKQLLKWAAPTKHESVIVATGNKRATLAELAASRQPVALSLGAFGGEAATYAVNGGPTLLATGQPVKRTMEEGWPFASATQMQANAMHRFITMRAPRTALGVTAVGDILLVVVDGWRFRDDEGPAVPMNGGATIAELTTVMQELGAIDAINLDGGGSSVMVTSNGIVSNPSDKDGERAVGDSLILIDSK